MKQIEEILTRAFVRSIDWVRRHARLVIAVDTMATLALGVFTLVNLGVNMDNKELIDEDLPFQRAAAAYARYFPSLDDSLLLVVDGESPELARQGAQALADRLRADPERFSDVYVPGGGSFFQRRGLLYQSPAELDHFAGHLARLQPVIAELKRDPSIANLATLIRAGLEEKEASQTSPEQWAAVLDRIGEATIRVYDEYPLSISWERLMLEGSTFDPGTRQVVIAEPVLDFDSLLAAGQAMDAIRTAAAELSLVTESGVKLRITGNPALNYEEMLGLAWDIGIAGVFSFALVTAVLFVALRSLRLVSASALTLLTGLVWTAAFAAASVGRLNLLSIAFGVLFIGLGIDFAIHLAMQYADAVQRGASSDAALRAAAERVGSSLVMCAVTTAIGFLAFVPTEYKGVAELGLISGMGMFVILLQTTTLFPALVSVLMGQDAAARLQPSFPLRLAPPAVVATHPRTVAVVALALGIVAAASLQNLRFDSNVITMRDQSTESVEAFKDLLADSDTSPWYIDVLAPDLPGADQVADRLLKLEAVESAITLADYVPADQDEKLEILADAAFLLDVPLTPATKKSSVPIDEQLAALRDLHATLEGAWLETADAPLAGSARHLRDRLEQFLAQVEEDGDPSAALAELERLLLGNVPEQLDRLERSLDPPRITQEALPADLAERMLASDGHARVQVFPSADLADSVEMARFVDVVRAVEPDATGVAVNLIEFGRATSRSLRQALVAASIAIALLLFALWRRMVEAALVLGPLLLAGVLTAASMVVLDMPLNFVNVVVLPLLLGIGVDSGIHLVHRSHTVGSDEATLLATTTARAVFFSAVTTTASFGTLAFSAHRGIASLGTLLVCGMIMTLASNLVVLPALIALRGNAAARPPSRPSSQSSQ